MLQSLTLIGQIESSVPKYDNGDTSIWYLEINNLIKKLEIKPISILNNKWSYRVWLNDQIIDVWSDSTDEIYGTISYWAKEVNESNKKARNGIFLKKFELSHSQNINLLEQIDSFNYENIPDQNYISYWHPLKDGVPYIIEYKDSMHYWFKSYDSPFDQKDVNEAIIVSEFVQSIYETCASRENESDFTASVPFECYTNWGPMMICKVLSKKEKRKLRRIRKAYR